MRGRGVLLRRRRRHARFGSQPPASPAEPPHASPDPLLGSSPHPHVATAGPAPRLSPREVDHRRLESPGAERLMAEIDRPALGALVREAFLPRDPWTRVILAVCLARPVIIWLASWVLRREPIEVVTLYRPSGDVQYF